MQPDTDLFDALQVDLAELKALHTPSGAEQPVIARLRELFAPLVDAVSIDHMGNLTATREGPVLATCGIRPPDRAFQPVEAICPYRHRW
jgi:hypothetical protein